MDCKQLSYLLVILFVCLCDWTMQEDGIESIGEIIDV